MIPANINSLLLSAEAGTAPTAYQISRSLRFNSADGAYLDRTPTSAGNRKTFTFSCWAKRSVLSTEQVIFAARTGATSPWFRLLFRGAVSVDSLHIQGDTSLSLLTTAFFRDTTAWLHIVVAIDTTQATSSNRVKLYINGTQVTVFGTATYPAQNADLAVNSTAAHNIGVELTNSIYFNGYLADIHLIDGQALTPGDFAETDATTGQWVPKAYSGTYGTNGFRLNFSDNSGTTSTTLGKDAAGSNNWTPNNFSVTAGAGNDSFVDSPSSYGTDTGIGGEVRGNYATLNPLSTVTTVTLANGNLDHSSATTGQNAIATIGASTGKWYWEVVATAGTTQTRVGVYSTAASSLYSLAANNTVYGIRFDADAGTLDRTTDGSSWTSIATGLTSGPYFPYFNNNGTTAKTVTVNFGQRPFAYPVSGYKALCDTNLTAPTIAKPSTMMDTTLWTGNGSARSITGLGFSPDFVWIKGRSGATDHALYDAMRGVQLDLVSNSTAAETTQSQGLTAFNSDGFSLGTLAKVNTNAATYAGWAWDAGSSNTTNTNGTITSTVRANTSAGFSIVTYTGNAVANSTIGHGLGVAPSLIVIKRRDAITNWIVFTTAVDGSNDIFTLNTTDAKANALEASPTSTVFTIGGGTGQNGNNSPHVAYCFAPVTNYSEFGSYTGNGNASGPFVYLGFRPALVIVKMSSSTGNWTILDYKREGYNIDNDPLFPNLANAEGTTDLIDITSNGFKVRTTDATFNTNAGTYVYAAWAEYPFQYARAR